MAEQPGRWPRWATALCLLLGSSLLSALSFHIFVGPHWGKPVPFRAAPGGNPNAPEGARVAVPASGPPAAPGEWITVTWEVTNTGESIWAVDLYYFAPAGDGLPVIPLPRSVMPGEEVTVRAELAVPEGLSVWEPVWHLKGRRGQVEGGTLRVRLTAAPL